ncbi:hypothetical protein [Bacteroides sp.]
MENYMQSLFYPAVINGSPADHTYAELYEKNVRLDSYKCFGGNEGGQVGTISTYTSLESNKIYSVFSEKKVRGTSDSTTMNYGINGVCHQAANRFLHPSYVAMVTNIDFRPKGLTTSCYLYGEYGNTFYQYEHWRKKYYFKTCDKYGLVIDMSNCDQSSAEGSLWYKCEKKYREKTTAGDYVDDILFETAAMLSIYIPSLKENPILETQRSMLKEREKFLKTHGIYFIEETGETHIPILTRDAVKQLVENVNELGKQIQSELMSKIGEKLFVSLHGTKEFTDIADLDMAYTFLLK